MILSYFFFLLPFLLYLGIAAQGTGFYLICIFLPFTFYIAKNRKAPKFFIAIGLYLAALHIIFPIFNFINYFIQNKSISETTYSLQSSYPMILQSNFPTAMLFGGSITAVLTYLSQKEYFKKRTNLKDPILTTPLKFFIAGLLPASILFCISLIYQHYSGIEYRSFEKYGPLLTNDNLLKNGGYRVYGLYGHPLTVAAVGLAYAAFSWCLLWLLIAKKNLTKFHFIPFQDKKILPYIYLFVITIANTITVFLSSGRTATIANVLILLGVPILLCLRKKPILTSLAIIIISISSFFIGKKYGVLDRIDVTANSVLNSHSLDGGNNRQYFWKVYTQMIFDNPILGQGNYWIRKGVRDQYYDRLGYSKIPEKYNAHNNYLEILASIGILGFLLILYFVYMIDKTLKKQFKIKQNASMYLFFPLTAMFIANLFHSFTQNVYFDSSVVYVYLSIIYVIMWQLSVDENHSKT